jgi:hypothetical protein
MPEAQMGIERSLRDAEMFQFGSRGLKPPATPERSLRDVNPIPALQHAPFDLAHMFLTLR